MKVRARPAPALADDAQSVVDASVAPPIVREMMPWYVERHAARDTRQNNAISGIAGAFQAYERVLSKWKAERKADPDLPISRALKSAATKLLTSIVEAAATAGVTCTVEDHRLRFVSGDNLLVRFTKSLAGNLGTEAVYAPLELADRGAKGTFIHSPRTMLLSELGVRTLRPQTTELHEARHAHHFALHREGATPTILDARLVPGFGADKFTGRDKGYLSGFSVDELVTHGLQGVQDRGALSQAVRGEGSLELQRRAFLDAAARAKKHAHERNGPKLAAQLAADAEIMFRELSGAIAMGKKKIRVGRLALSFTRNGDGSLRCTVGNSARKTNLRLNLRNEQCAQAFERAMEQRDSNTFSALASEHIKPWIEKLHRFSLELSALFAKIVTAADTLASDPTRANGAALERLLSQLSSTLRSASRSRFN